MTNVNPAVSLSGVPQRAAAEAGASVSSVPDLGSRPARGAEGSCGASLVFFGILPLDLLALRETALR